MRFVPAAWKQSTGSRVCPANRLKRPPVCAGLGQWLGAVNRRTGRGRGSKHCCLPPGGAGSGGTAGRWPTRSCPGCAPACPRGTCPNGTGRGRPRTSGCGSGPSTARGRRSWTRRSPGTAPVETGGRPGRQGLFPSLDPHRIAVARDQVHQSRAQRPEGPPRRQGQQRRPPAGFRPGGIPPAQRRRALFQPTQALPRPGHPRSPNALRITGRNRSSRPPSLASMIRRTGPRRAATLSNAPGTPPRRRRGWCPRAGPGPPRSGSGTAWTGRRRPGARPRG